MDIQHNLRNRKILKPHSRSSSTNDDNNNNNNNNTNKSNNTNKNNSNNNDNTEGNDDDFNKVNKSNNNEYYELRNRKILKSNSKIQSRNNSKGNHKDENMNMDNNTMNMDSSLSKKRDIDQGHTTNNRIKDSRENNDDDTMEDIDNMNINDIRNDKKNYNSELVNHNSTNNIDFQNNDKIDNTDRFKNNNGNEDNNHNHKQKSDLVMLNNKDKGKTRVEQIIKLVDGVKSYDILEELKNTPAHISIAQLLGLSNKLRTDITKSFRKNKLGNDLIVGVAENYDNLEDIEIVNNPFHEYNSKKVQEHDIAVVRGSVDDKTAAIFIDGCSNANLVTRSFLNDNSISYKILGSVSSRVHQAISDTEEYNYELVELTVDIGKVKVKSLFRISEKEDSFYDIIIGLKTQHDNRLIVDTVDKCLSIKNKDNMLEPIVPLEDISLFHSSALLCYLFDDNFSISANTLFTSSSNKGINNNINTCNIKDYINKNNNKDKDKNYIIDELVVNVDVKDNKFKNDLKNLLSKYGDVVAISSDDLEPSNLLPHHIELIEGSKPIKQKAYRISQVQLKVKEELKKLISKGLIVPSHSSWSSPVVLVPKKNGYWRLCIDYRRVNEVTKKDVYAIPNIREIFDALKDATIFSTIDLFSGYHQIPMYPRDQEITSFTTKYGNYYFKVMPFGLTNAPATFQREMNRIFFELINDCVQIYLDDLIVYSPTIEQHIIDLGKVFQILRDNKLKLNIEKCSFCKFEVDALGHKVTNKGLLPIDKKIEAINQLKQPENITELRSFLGMVGYYRSFIKNYASISAPLCKLLRKNVPFKWTSEQSESFDKLITALTNAPILCYPKYNLPFIIRSDASFTGIGGVLLQLCEDKLEHPICFVSRTLKRAEYNYSITELEGTAAYYCVSQFKQYILGNPYKTTLYTDHQPLVPIFQKNEPTTSKHARWCSFFSQLQIDVVYQPGKANVIADALSRIKRKDDIILDTLVDKNNNTNKTSNNDNSNYKNNDSTNSNNINNSNINININNDNNNNGNNNDNINSNNRENNNQNIEGNNQMESIDEIENERYISEFMKKFLTERIVNIDNKTYIRDHNKLRLIIDDYMEKIKIIGMAHRIGHEGIQKTYERVKQNYYWKNMILDIKKYISICKICQLNKSQPIPNLVEKFRTPIEAPFVRMGLDIIGPLKTTTKGNKYIIVCVDYFTLWTEAEAYPSATSQDVINFLVNVFSRHGLPQIINTDNGPQLDCDFTKIFLDLYGTYIHFVVRYHPPSNGLVENRNREIGKQLRNFAGDNDDWDQLLPLALWAIRSAKSSVSGYSSFELLYGREDMLPTEVVLLNSLETPIERTMDELLLERFMEHTKWVKDAANKKFGTINYWKTRREAKRSMDNVNDYKIGDKVKIRIFQRSKLDPYYVGPYTIEEITWNTVKLKEDRTGIILKRNIHMKNILPYQE